MSERRALSSMRPPVSRSGDAKVAGVLFEALTRAATDDPDTLTHGFHSWPARLHPAIAATILDARAKPGQHVVDPFCGSGTTLIEARLRGLPATGTDLNPVGLRVAEVKTDVRDESARAAFLARLDEVVARSKERVRAKAP